MTEASLLTQVLVAEKYGPRLGTDQLATVLGISRGARITSRITRQQWKRAPTAQAKRPWQHTHAFFVGATPNRCAAAAAGRCAGLRLVLRARAGPAVARAALAAGVAGAGGWLCVGLSLQGFARSVVLPLAGVKL